MSEFERERERLMENEAPDLPFGRKPQKDSTRNLGLWVAGILLALAVPLFYVAFGLAGALVATGALPVVLVVAALFIAVVGLSGVFVYTRLRRGYDQSQLYRDDFGNQIGGIKVMEKLNLGGIMKKDVVVCGTLDSLYDCAKEMYQHNVGFLVILNEHDLCMGVVTDRDLVCGGIAQSLDITSTPVTAVMEQDFNFLPPEASLEDCLLLMRNEGIRRVPILSDGKLLGIVTVDDLIAEERVSIAQVAPVLRRQLQEPNPHHGLKPQAA